MSEDDQDLRAELERLRVENQALKARSQQEIRLQVSQKGAVSLYGLRRFPITLYADEWERILDLAGKVRAFIKENEGSLSRKG